jgi:hypothetical protein
LPGHHQCVIRKTLKDKILFRIIYAPETNVRSCGMLNKFKSKIILFKSKYFRTFQVAIVALVEVLIFIRAARGLIGIGRLVSGAVRSLRTMGINHSIIIFPLPITAVTFKHKLMKFSKALKSREME